MASPNTQVRKGNGQQNGNENAGIARRPTMLPANIDAESVASIDALIHSQVSELAMSDGTIFGRAMVMAKAVNDLRKAITPQMMEHVMALQGSRMGFRTDKDREGGYKDEVVKECLVEALLLGALPTGNEMNIIAGNTYLTLEFFRRKQREWPGLTDLEISLGIPIMSDKGAAVECYATWKMNGHERRIEFLKTEKHDSRIAVKVNAGMGFDAVLGKAERKLRARIHQKLTGSVHTVDGETDDAIVTQRTSFESREKECSESIKAAKTPPKQDVPSEDWDERFATQIGQAKTAARLDAIQSDVESLWNDGKCDGPGLMALIEGRRSELKS